MFHWFSVVRNKWGAPLANWQIEVVNPATEAVVDIYSDSSETAISTVSGIANRAKSDSNGNYGFFVANGTYDLLFYNASGVFQSRVEDVPMYGNEANNLPRGTGGTDLAISFAEDNDTGIYSPGADAIQIRAGVSGPSLLVGGGGAGVTLNYAETPSAALSIVSKTGGVLFPSLTTTERNAMISPANGLVIYNSTDSKLQVRAGGSWVDLH